MLLPVAVLTASTSASASRAASKLPEEAASGRLLSLPPARAGKKKRAEDYSALFIVSVFPRIRVDSQFTHNRFRRFRDLIAALFTQVFIVRQRLSGKGMQKRFAQQLAVGRVTQVIHLTTRAFIGEDFNTFRGMETVIFFTCSLFLPCSAYGLIYSPLHSAMRYLNPLFISEGPEYSARAIIARSLPYARAF